MGWLQLGEKLERQQGICDGTVHDLPTLDFDEYHKHCTRDRRIVLGDDHIAVLVNGDIPVATRYVPVYRIHNKNYFHSAEHFYLNWDESARRLQQFHRFSPPGTMGFYFGITLEAALDEAMYYSKGPLSDDQIILVMDCYFDNILYLMHPLVIRDIWKKVGLPDTTVFQMYLALMNPDTSNDMCLRIGIWARQRGYDGLIYPSARYGQRTAWHQALKERLEIVPAVNFVPLGTKICGYSVEPAMWFYQQLYHHMQGSRRRAEFVPIFAEPNLVLFNNKQITGFDRATFYWTFPLDKAEQVAASDQRSGSKSYTEFVNTKSDMSIVFDSSFNKWVMGDILNSGETKHRSCWTRIKQYFTRRQS